MKNPAVADGGYNNDRADLKIRGPEPEDNSIREIGGRSQRIGP